MSGSRAEAMLGGFVMVSGDSAGFLSTWHASEAAPIRTIPAHSDAIIALLPLTSAPRARIVEAKKKDHGREGGEAGETPVGVASTAGAEDKDEKEDVEDEEGKARAGGYAKKRWLRSGERAAQGTASRGGADPDDPRLPALMVSVCVDGTVKLWEVKHYRLKELGAFDTTLPGEAGVSCACLR